MLPFLCLAQVVLMYLAVRTTLLAKAISRDQAKALYWVIVLLALWAPISAALALKGIYKQPVVIENLPAFWYTGVPLLLMLIPWGLSASFRASINQIIETIGLHKVVWFEGIRITAIGGITKAAQGEFSAEFGFYVGIPDLIFGVLSLVAGYLLYKKALSLKWIVCLNLYGFLIIVPFGLVLLNMGIPGPWHVIHATPDMITMFEYPMALAPTAVVPIFIVVNAWIINYVRYVDAKKN